MIGAIKQAWANFRGFDLTGSTVPPMDGPLRPNSKLDAAPVLLDLADVDNLVV
ncbi:strictosidine synthase, partial [Mesorhizobium sp. M7A.F.Ca.CA.001.09.2.1]